MARARNNWVSIQSAPRDGRTFAAREQYVDRVTGRLLTIKADAFRAEGQWCRKYRGEIIYWAPTEWVAPRAEVAP